MLKQMVKKEMRISIFIVLSLVSLLIIYGSVWVLDRYLVQKMAQICDKMNMTYSYHDSASFYCISRTTPLAIKEVKYR